MIAFLAGSSLTDSRCQDLYATDFVQPVESTDGELSQGTITSLGPNTEMYCDGPLTPANGFQIAIGETLNNCWSYGTYLDGEGGEGMQYHDARDTFDITVLEDGTVETSGNNGIVVIVDVEIPEVCLSCPEIQVGCSPDCADCEIHEDSCDECAYALCLDEDEEESEEEEVVEEESEEEEQCFGPDCISEEEADDEVPTECPEDYSLVIEVTNGAFLCMFYDPESPSARQIQYYAIVPMGTYIGLGFGADMIDTQMVAFYAGSSTSESRCQDLFASEFD